MTYALDVLIGVLCILVAIPLLMQLKRSPKYRRFVDGDGNPIDVKALVRDGMQSDGTVTVQLDFESLNESLKQEIVVVSCADMPMPEGEGWILDEGSDKNISHFALAAYGAILAFAAFCLVFASAGLGVYAAWALFAGAAVIVLTNIPRLPTLIGQGHFHPFNFVFFGIAFLGVAVGFRLF